MKNFSFTNVDGQIYYRENSFMNKVELPAVTAERVLGMIALREPTRKLLDCQLHDGSDAEVQLLQNELKQQYTAFKAQYGLINSTANKRAFRQDSSYCLLASLEILDEEKNLKRLADILPNVPSVSRSLLPRWILPVKLWHFPSERKQR